MLLHFSTLGLDTQHLRYSILFPDFFFYMNKQNLLSKGDLGGKKSRFNTMVDLTCVSRNL